MGKDILQVINSPLTKGGLSQYMARMSDILVKKGHNLYLFVGNYKGTPPILKDKLKKVKILEGKYLNLKESKFDLIIHHTSRKSARNTPHFYGPSVVFYHTIDLGFRDIYKDCKRIFFYTDWHKRHTIEDCGKTWKEFALDNERRMRVLYPCIDEDSILRRARTEFRVLGHQNRRHKMHGELDNYLNKNIRREIIVKKAIDSLFFPFQRKRFLNKIDAVYWACRTKDTFSFCLHEAIFAGCVPIVMERDDGSNEFVKKYNLGFRFSKFSELKEIVNFLKKNKVVFTEESKKALEASRIFNYDEWYKRFKEEIQEIVEL